MRLASLDSQHTSTHHACAACKYQRRKCSKDCPLAPYFPSGGDDCGNNEDFMNAHKLFGVGKVSKLLKKVGLENRDETVKSVIFEANARKAYPVEGCYGIVVNLLNQIRACEAELGIVVQQFSAFRSVAAGQNGDIDVDDGKKSEREVGMKFDEQNRSWR